MRREKRFIYYTRMSRSSTGHAGFWSDLLESFFVAFDLFPQLLDRVLEKSAGEILQRALLAHRKSLRIDSVFYQRHAQR